MALTAAKNLPELGLGPLPKSHCLKQKGSTTCYSGGLAVIDAGYVKPGALGLGLIAVGFFDFDNDNGVSVNAGADGAEEVAVKPGVRQLENSAGDDAITQVHVGQVAWIVDDETVACRGLGTRSPAGIIVAVDSGGVWVAVGIALLSGGGLAGLGIQAISGTLAAGTCTISTGIHVTAASRALVVPSANITGTTNFGQLAHIIASNGVGAPGAGSIIIRALGDDGALDADAAGTFHGILIG